MPNPRWRLILNGKSAGDEALRDAVGTMRDRGMALDVRVTWEDGDAAREVAGAIEAGIDTVIAAGGDGTLNEVATALARHDMPTDALPSLALVPLGTANDFASAAGLPQEPLPALELVASTRAVAFDLLRIDTVQGAHWCANLASGGFGTQVTAETREGLKKMLGGLAYVLTGLSKLGRIEPVEAAFHGPGFEWRGGFIALGIGNGRQAGGGQALCPDAVVDDGLLELTIIPPLDSDAMATLGTLVSDGREAALERIAVRASLSRLDIEAEEPLTLNLDGEPLESRIFRIECVPGRLRMHLPVDCTLLSRHLPLA